MATATLARRRTSRRPKTIQAEEFDAEEILGGYQDDYLDCRDLRHPWRRVGSYREAGQICRLLRCPRCGTERVDRWRPNGERAQSIYRNRPEGYEIRGHHVSQQDIRLEIMRRVEVFGTYEQMANARLKSNVRRPRRKAS